MSDATRTLVDGVVEGRMVVHKLCQRCEHKRRSLPNHSRVHNRLTLRQLIPQGVLHWSDSAESFGSICHTSRRHRIAGGPQ